MRRHTLGAVLLAMAATAGAACTGDDATTSTAPTTTTPATPADVARHLATVVDRMYSLAAAPPIATREAVAEVEATLRDVAVPIGGTDPEALRAFTDAVQAFRDASATGDQGAMTAAAHTFSAAASAYLTAHPG